MQCMHSINKIFYYICYLITKSVNIDVYKFIIVAGGQGCQGLLGVGGGDHQANLRKAAARTQRGAPGPGKGHMKIIINKIFELLSKKYLCQSKNI